MPPLGTQRAPASGGGSGLSPPAPPCPEALELEEDAAPPAPEDAVELPAVVLEVEGVDEQAARMDARISPR